MRRQHVEKISKALADATRLLLYETIAARDGLNCQDLVKMRGVTPATISHHLKILADSGLIQCRREGQFVRSAIVPETIAEYTRALAKIAQPRKRPSRI